ncbi:hypothetical protein HPB50_025577 [Hyalomma asiaticum]|uniref:Uncharacterized protein n=1 Tax=Hyalomma asiaticum TaxID=266040 RepID=A0ACB7ST41_HYAAI|nr:hypothetical protein HPB50_025577 [Hyalomma asiaticum]
MPAVCLFSVSVLSGVGSNGVIGPEHRRCFARIFVRDVSSRYRKRNCTPCLPGSKVLPVLTFVVHLFVLAYAEVGSCSKHGTWEPPARLVLYFKSLTYSHIRSVPKYDETHVLGNLGGIIGMYLGLSFFVIFQVMDILVVGTLRLRKMLR